jgi:hypothetical protein
VLMLPFVEITVSIATVSLWQIYRVALSPQNVLSQRNQVVVLCGLPVNDLFRGTAQYAVRDDVALRLRPILHTLKSSSADRSFGRRQHLCFIDGPKYPNRVVVKMHVMLKSQVCKAQRLLILIANENSGRHASSLNESTLP